MCLEHEQLLSILVKCERCVLFYAVAVLSSHFLSDGSRFAPVSIIND